MTPEAVAAEVDAASLLGRGGAGFPAGRKWSMLRKSPVDLPGGQRRRERAGHLQGPPAGRAGPPPAHRGRGHRRLRPAGHPGLHLHAGRVRPRPRAGAGRPQRRLRPRGASARTSSARASRSTWSSTRGRAPTSAARRPPCSSRSRASGASPASSPRSSRPPSASTASPPWSTTSRPCPTCRGSCSTGARRSPPSGEGRSTGTRLFALAGHVDNPGVFELEMVKTTFNDLINAPVLGGGIPHGRASRRSSPAGCRPRGSVPTRSTFPSARTRWPRPAPCSARARSW